MIFGQPRLPLLLVLSGCLASAPLACSSGDDATDDGGSTASAGAAGAGTAGKASGGTGGKASAGSGGAAGKAGAGSAGTAGAAGKGGTGGASSGGSGGKGGSSTGGSGGSSAGGSSTGGSSAGGSSAAGSSAGGSAGATTMPTTPGLAKAPDMPAPTVVARRDGARIVVPVVDGAKDYRVFAATKDVVATSDDTGAEALTGATIFCAGREQHAVPLSPTSNPVERRIDVAGLTEATTLVVEALDTECPFTGVMGTKHFDLETVTDVQQMYGSDPTFPVRTEAEIRGLYGSLVVNGHGPSGVLGRPADPVVPRVLARATVSVTPLGTTSPPMPFWDDFATNDAFTYAGKYKDRNGADAGTMFENAKWTMSTYGTAGVFDPQSKQHTQAFVDRGRLVTLLPDWAQDVFGTNMLVPKHPAKLSDTGFLHLTVRAPSAVTNRRYLWFSFCGADAPGKTFDASGRVAGRMVMTPFFYQNDGLNPYVDGWNCLQVFPFEGGYYELPEGSPKPESSIRVILNRATPGDVENRDNVVNVSPNQWGAWAESPACSWCGWYRTWDASHTLGAPMLDGSLGPAPTVKLDIYVRRDRVVVYVDDEQKVCNGFPNAKLTMSDVAVGLGHVLYHSSAEQVELERDDWVRTGQRYIRTNTPWIDQRTWDDVGIEENVQLPPGLDEKTCHISTKAYP